MKNRSIIAATILLASTASLSAVQPKDILGDNKDTTTYADGVIIRKGSFAATLANAKAFEALKGKIDVEALEEIRRDQLELITPLEHVGMFAFIEPEEMLCPDKEGRSWLALLYYTVYPDRITSKFLYKLEELQGSASPLLTHEIERLLITLP